ncbi:MAG: lipoprotein signal peptidase [Prevotella sp.]|nr:lipoprotein signal peptidase [Prevotella sp.]
MKINKGLLSCILVLVLVAIDQLIKIEVKMNMRLGDEIYIFDWFRIRFIENNGMAWGMELGSKLFLSLFRIAAVCAGGWYIWQQIRRQASTGYIVLLSMILAGAAGNIFDSLFYGQIFTESTPWNVSTLTNFGDGYAPMLMGKVVDMFYFPLVEGSFPGWMPIWGGETFVFFSPIFNFADSCISVGIVILFLFFRNGHVSELQEMQKEP